MKPSTPFDPSELEMEAEVATRARLDSVEWGHARSLPIRNNDYQLDPQFEPYTASGTRLDKFTEEYDDLPIHVTLIESGVLFGEEFLVCDANHPTVSSERLYLTRHKRTLRRLELERIPVEDGPTYLVGANAEPQNFYHWNFQCLPSIVLLRSVARERNLSYRIVLPPIDGARWKSLELAGIDPSECVELRPDGFIQGAPMMYTTAMCGYYAFQPSAQLIKLMDSYLDNCLKRSRAKMPTRFYLSRKDAPGKREIENEADLEKALQRRAFERLVMSHLPIEDQVAAFAKAECIVAPHGAGLVNLMFAPQSANFLEILPENYRMAYFFRLAQVRGIHYSQVLSRVQDSWDGTDVHHCSLSVNVDKVLMALDQLEDRTMRGAA
ncbi:glycosyltransferase family 61 protein [bacterium]|nr:glycosyltransferase family 61 protein [bacterium]